jgi:N-acetylglutamate synthase-like GNAT family acetyltransferase
MLGCGQLKPHGQGVVEMASLAVVPEYQGRGIGGAIITYLLKLGPRPLYLMCRSGLGPLYEKYGFQKLTPGEMPRYFRRMTQLAGLASTLARREETLLIMKLQ